ncbi:hypothetical protein RintRC_1650 [Richelia intracellularis]|nr:hypothetical protein RintRC_1650 [Richelia intracellularis]
MGDSPHHLLKPRKPWQHSGSPKPHYLTATRLSPHLCNAQI